MKIRRYLGKDTQEAILKVKMDLGSEAVILNTKKVRQKGILNLFAKPLVEVLAAIDEDYGRKKEQDPQGKNQKIHTQEKGLPANSVPDEKAQKISQLETKVNSMESLLQKIYSQIQNGVLNKTSETSEEKEQTHSDILQLFYSNLLKNDVEIEIAKSIIDSLRDKVGECASVNDTASVLYNILSGYMGKPETIKLREDGKPTVVIFLGPTGVGKTTTLAKIAANFSLNQKKNVGLITADTYRIAAVEQLKTYAEILGMPVSVIYSPGEIKESIEQHGDKDVILIDTAGRSYKNKPQFDEIESLVQASQPDEVFLVLSTTTSLRNCKEIISHYSFLKNYKLIFTKLDETPMMGVIFNVRYLTGKCISYITTGQSVPDDIEVANTEKISKTLMGSIN